MSSFDRFSLTIPRWLITSTVRRSRPRKLHHYLGRNQSETTDWNPSALFQLVENAYIETLETNASIRVASRKVETKIEDLGTRLESNSNDLSLFETRLARLTPVRASGLRAIQHSWPQGPMVLGRIVDAGNRVALFSGWAATEPTWLATAHAEALAWLGNMAADIDAKQAALHFFDRALDQGISPRGYWKVRRAWVTSFSSTEELVEYLSEDVAHPLAKLVVASAKDGPHRLAEILNEWEVQTDDELATLIVMRCRLAEQRKDLDLIIEVGKAGYEKLKIGPAGLAAVRALIARGAVMTSPLTRNDFADARDLALRVRDDRRLFGLSSAEAVAEASSASRLLNDTAGAWNLTQAIPDGMATKEEAQSIVVRSSALLIAADRGDLQTAKSLLEDDLPDFTLAKARARISANEGDRDGELEHWKRAIELTSDPEEKAHAAHGMGLLGYEHPYIDELANDNSEIAEEIRATARLFSGSAEGLASAKANARVSQSAAQTLLMFYGQKGNTVAGAKLAESTAHRWPDPSTWLTAARLNLSLGEAPKAIENAKSALLAGGPGWGGTADCHLLLAQCFSSLDDWESATKSALDLVAADPESDGARWILVICQLSAGDSEAALISWSGGSKPLLPESRQQVLAWIELFKEHGRQIATPTEVMEVSKEWHDDEEIRRHIVGAFLSGADDFSEDERSPASEVIPSYLADFPDAQYIIPITVDEGNVLESLKEAIFSRVDEESETTRAAAIQDMNVKIWTAEWPVGMATSAYGKTYAETAILGASPFRFASDANIHREVESVATAVAMTTVVDTTAMFSQVLLSSSLGNALSGAFTDLVVTAEQYRDASQGNQAIKSSSTISLNVNGSSNAATANVITDEELAQRFERAAALWQLFGTMRRVSHPQLTGLEGSPGDGDHSVNVWLSAADESITGKHAFWCDDLALRKMLSATDVPHFGTPAVLEYLRQSGVVDPQLLVMAEATLISNGYVGVVFRSHTYEIASQIDGPDGRGTLAAMTKGSGDNLHERIDLALQIISRNAEHPHFVADWAAGIATWLIEVANDTDAAITAWTGLDPGSWTRCHLGYAASVRVADLVAS